ncbi:hypothetical protein EK21DRAFT_20389, partial [Setomelanomma holmii]
LLHDISSSLDEQTRSRVAHTLKEVENDIPALTIPALVSTHDKRRRASTYDEPDSESHILDEDQVSASVGLNENMDVLEDDFLSDERAAGSGFMGRNAQIQWMRTLQRKLDQPGREPSEPPHAPPGGSNEAFLQRSEALRERRKHSALELPLADYDFYLNDTEVDISVSDLEALPSAGRAMFLLQIYRTHVQNPFRILDEAFLNEVSISFQDYGSRFPATWKGVLNLVFAIATRFLLLNESEHRGHDRDHFEYVSRAMHYLNLTQFSTLVSNADLLIIQATGLLSFYYLAIGHVNRAWYTVGIALRHAQAAGLHLRNEDPSISQTRKRTMAQIWWALHSIECILTSITGRPRITAHQNCTVPNLAIPAEDSSLDAQRAPTRVPAPASGPSSAGRPLKISKATGTINSADLFVHGWIRLDNIQHKIFSRLYSARIAVHSWKYMQTEISSLNSELETWALQELPHGPIPTVSDTEPPLEREVILLYMYYQSAKICITRPCLCRLDRRIKGQSEVSAKFNQRTAEACVKAAQDITSLLPDSPNSRWLSGRGPWWCAVHIIMQAITVLLIELAQATLPLTSEPSELTACVQKLELWLQVMKNHDGVAHRAYNVVRNLL